VSNRKPTTSGRRSDRKRGQAMVEFALVIPIFMLVLSGILDFGFSLYSRMTVINATREGARAAVMVSDVTTIPLVVSTQVISSASSGGITVLPANVVVSCVKGTTTSTVSPCNFNNVHSDTHTDAAQAGDYVSVTVNYSYHTFFPLAFGATFNLSSTVQMVLE
jgi:Flp pilus assembly protein TadG